VELEKTEKVPTTSKAKKKRNKKNKSSKSVEIVVPLENFDQPAKPKQNVKSKKSKKAAKKKSLKVESKIDKQEEAEDDNHLKTFMTKSDECEQKQAEDQCKQNDQTETIHQDYQKTILDPTIMPMKDDFENIARMLIKSSLDGSVPISTESRMCFKCVDFIALFFNECIQTMMLLSQNENQQVENGDTKLLHKLSQNQPKIVTMQPLINFIKLLAQLHSQQLLMDIFIATLISKLMHSTFDNVAFAVRTMMQLFGQQLQATNCEDFARIMTHLQKHRAEDFEAIQEFRESGWKVPKTLYENVLMDCTDGQFDELLLQLYLNETEVDRFLDVLMQFLMTKDHRARSAAEMITKISQFNLALKKNLFKLMTSRFETFRTLGSNFFIHHHHIRHQLGAFAVFAFELFKLQFIDDCQLKDWLSLKLAERIPRDRVMEILAFDDTNSFRIKIFASHLQNVQNILRN
jgi:hypothetical protein